MPNLRIISHSGVREESEGETIPIGRYWEGFLASELGSLYSAIPWSDMVTSLGLEEKSRGRKSYFSPEGKLALLFLKHYCCCSDARLLSLLNGSIHLQFFCGIQLDPLRPLSHRQLVSRIRTEIAELLEIESLQKVLANYWKPYMQESENVLIDATCYESEVRYPTDPKLLWESVHWLYQLLRVLHRSEKLRMPRTKYLKWSHRYGNYRRKRKPRVKQRKQIKGGLLRLLKKLLGILEDLETDHSLDLSLLIKPQYLRRIETIKTVYKQQYQLFREGEKPKRRIVSLSKAYLRPIVRGKENKSVEFGAKVNKIQIDGINFIEHLSFEAFNEGTRLKQSIALARKLVGKILRTGADGIYANNANRSYCTKNNIFNDFIPKGRKAKDEDQKKILRKAITKERVSRLEGSFGNEKNAYYLRKVKARTKKNEILWIFLGIHTANAVLIDKRMATMETSIAA